MEEGQGKVREAWKRKKVISNVESKLRLAEPTKDECGVWGQLQQLLCQRRRRRSHILCLLYPSPQGCVCVCVLNDLWKKAMGK